MNKDAIKKIIDDLIKNGMNELEAIKLAAVRQSLINESEDNIINNEKP